VTVNVLQKKFSFGTRSGPDVAHSQWLHVGKWSGADLWFGLNGFYLEPLSDAPRALDDYEVAGALYLAVKERQRWTHAEMAEALGVRSRTAEGMALGRVSAPNRRKLARLASGISPQSPQAR
jgi:hypothetical protein